MASRQRITRIATAVAWAFMLTSQAAVAHEESEPEESRIDSSQAAVAHEESALEESRIEVQNLFQWATGDSPNWGKGGLLAGLGLIGALVTVFGLIGGAVPGTAGFAKIDADQQRVEEREKILQRLIEKGDPEPIKAVEVATNNLRDDVSAARRRQFVWAAVLYAVLGAAFAAALAQDLLQALVIGAGWTSYLGALGLKKDYAERKATKDKITENLEAALESRQELSDELKMEAMASKAI